MTSRFRKPLNLCVPSTVQAQHKLVSPSGICEQPSTAAINIVDGALTPVTLCTEHVLKETLDVQTAVGQE